MKTPHIIIVGAGLAGLAAGYELAKHNRYTITLVEERNRVGGRVHTLPINGVPVDFGGFIIYPWYHQFRRLLQELKLDTALRPMTIKQMYYQLDHTHHYYTTKTLPIQTRDKARVASALLPKLLRSTNVATPNLELFHHATVADYFKATPLYQTYADVIAQGYCYPSITAYRMAFMAPFIYQTNVHGDLSKSDFLPNGNNQLPLGLATAITTAGHTIRYNTAVTGATGTTLHTNQGDITGDQIIFAQNVTEPLFNQLVPNLPPTFNYTQYYTVTIAVSNPPTVNNQTNWGAVFYLPNQADIQISSSVNLGTLYGVALKNYINLNIVVRQSSPTTPLTAEQLFTVIQPELQQLFPDCTCQNIVELVHWPKTMPVATEAYVQAIRAAQGKQHYYFAGDWLGSPSMETALVTGITAANQILAQ